MAPRIVGFEFTWLKPATGVPNVGCSWSFALVQFEPTSLNVREPNSCESATARQRMKVVLLGTGGYYPTNRRHTACMMLPEVGVVLDAGTGMCRVGEFLQTERLDIFLTHAHLDHVAGLTYLLNVVPEDVQAASVVHGEGAKLAAVREHLFAEEIFPVPPRFRFAQLSAAPMNLAGGGQLTWFPLEHPGGSIGYRLEWPGHSMAYVTDTTARKGAAYVEKIRRVDLLIHEA